MHQGRGTPDRSSDLVDGRRHPYAVIATWHTLPSFASSRHGVHPDASECGVLESEHATQAHAVTALYNAGYLGANVCAQNDDRDGSNRCKKILEAANDLEVSRVLLDKAPEEKPLERTRRQIKYGAALGMENVAV